VVLNFREYILFTRPAKNTILNTIERYAVKLNQTNIQANNNKFYIIQLLVSNAKSSSGARDPNSQRPLPNEYIVFTRWGRNGVPGQWNHVYSKTFIRRDLIPKQKLQQQADTK
jgi:hypothetical protein